MDRLRGWRDLRSVRRILDGDTRLADRWVTEQYPRVYRMLRHLTGSAEDAEDLAQQTFLKAWRALPDFKGVSSFSTWLHRIAFHEYTHWLRSRRPTSSLAHISEPPAPDTRQGRIWEAVLVEWALAQLEPQHREAAVLFYLQGLSVREIAGVANTPEGTVKYHLHMARRRLRELLSEVEEVSHETLEA